MQERGKAGRPPYRQVHGQEGWQPGRQPARQPDRKLERQAEILFLTKNPYFK